MDALGTWQDLTIDFLVTTDINAARVRLQKTMCDTVRLRTSIDHVKVELVKPVPKLAFLDAEPKRLTRGRVGSRTVPLRVLGWPAGVERMWPLSSGIPIPQGDLVDAARVRLTDGDSRPVPCQTEAVSRWQDGSVRWLLVDAQLPQPNPLVLHYGREVEATEVRTALAVEEATDGIRGLTGRLEFTVKRQGFDLLESVKVGTKEMLAPGLDRFTLTTDDGVVHRAARDSGSQSAEAMKKIPRNGISSWSTLETIQETAVFYPDYEQPAGKELYG